MLLHQILYILHVLGMAAILFFSISILFKKEMQVELKKKFSLYIMSVAHAQFFTGFILFFLLLSEVNHAKIGVKLLLAIVIAALASIYKKKIYSNQQPHSAILPILFTISAITALVAFFWK